MTEETAPQINVLPGTENREIVEILTELDKIELLTDIKPKEIAILSMLETIAEDPLPSAEGLKIENSIVKDIIFRIKKNRISENRESRNEVITALWANSSREDEPGSSVPFLDKILRRDRG